MKLTRQNVWAHVDAATNDELTWLFHFLVLPQKYNPFGKTEVFSAFDVYAKRFYAGLIPIVEQGARDAGIELNINDTRPSVNVQPVHLPWLRDYQLDVVADCLEKQIGIVDAPTGSGKTNIIVAVCACLEGDVLIVVPRVDLLWQTKERYESLLNERCGVWGDGAYEPRRVVVATFDTLYKGLAVKDGRTTKRLSKYSAVLVDEVHVVAGKKTMLVLRELVNARVRLGFSGTPLDRSDEQGLLTIGATGPVIHKIHMADLYAGGWLAKPTVHLVQQPIPTFRTGLPSWHDAESRVLGNKQRLFRIAKVAAGAPKPAIVFVRLLEHGLTVQEYLERFGMRTAFAEGKLNSTRRAELRTKLMNNELDVLVASVIFQVGVDMPALRSGVWAAGGKASIPVLQSLGRGMRKTTDKEEFDLYDMLDAPCELCANVPVKKMHRVCKWFDDHRKKRLSIYRESGHDFVLE